MGNREQFCLKKRIVSSVIPFFLKKYRLGEYEIGNFV